MSTVVSWNLQLSVREGRLDDFRSLMDDMVKSTRTESGTLIYEWFLSEDRTVCHIYERYADSNAAMAHLDNFGSKFADRFLDCVEPTSLCVYGEPTDAVRAALDGLAAVYLGTFGGFSR